MAAINGLVSANVLSAEDFAEGLIAALAIDGKKTITASQTQLHRAFRRVLVGLDERQDLKVDLREVDYDPLYGLSGWLDKFLARAQRDLMISFPNPSYERIEIQLTPAEGERLLRGYGHQEAFRELSSLFNSALYSA